jgi:hypothetical protein
VARSISITVLDPPSVGTPQWFTDLAPLTWLPIATGNSADGARGGSLLSQVTYQNNHVWPTGFVGKGRMIVGGDARNYCQNSNGAAVDPVNAEMFLVSNGGHGGYMGNETMRLRLRTATPSWERFVESTPPDYLPPAGTDPGGTNVAAFWAEESYLYPGLAWHSYLDGPAYTTPVTTGPVTRRPASAHTSCLPTYSEGKVWFPILNSTNLNGGRTSPAKYALNVQSVRDNPALKNWTYGDIAPWEFHGMRLGGTEDTQAYMMFSGSALDSATGRIWTPYSAESSAPRTVLMMETRGANAGRHQVFTNPTSFRIGSGNCPRIITVTDVNGVQKKLLVTMSTKRWDTDVRRFVITVDISALETRTITYSGAINQQCVNEYVVQEPTPLLWQSPERASFDPSGTLGPGAGWGLVYHDASKAFLAFNCDQSVGLVNGVRTRQGALRKLALPLNAQGRYDPVNFQWKWTEVPIDTGPGGVNVPTTCSPGGFITGGSWSRFNVVPQFDGTNDLLISLNSYNTATSVMKLPPRAL